jgi:hypothetical protein
VCTTILGFNSNFFHTINNVSVNTPSHVCLLGNRCEHGIACKVSSLHQPFAGQAKTLLGVGVGPRAAGFRPLHVAGRIPYTMDLAQLSVKVELVSLSLALTGEPQALGS